MRRGRTHPDEAAEPFGVTQFALRSSRRANGVSARHGEVAREMWHDLWPDRAVADVPITHVTNGVHVPTWIGGPVEELLDRHLGAGWVERTADPATWEAVAGIPGDELWAARCAQRGALIELARERSAVERLARGDTAEYVRAAQALDPDVLTIGFARRVATYKRLDLMLRDVDRALALLADTERPVQLILAGKAHPRDDDGKRLVQRLFGMKAHAEVGRRVDLPRRLRPHARLGDGPRLRRLGQRPPAAARGQRHERDEVRRQRRAAARRARRLVARGLRRHQRLGDRRRGGP